MPTSLESIARDYFTPYQLAWIRDESLLKIVEKSRRVGLSYATSYRRVTKAMRTPGLTTWVMTRDLTTAKEFIRDCARWCRLANIIATGVSEDHFEVLDERKGITAQCILFPNGARIYALTSNPDAAAGKGGDFVLDEFALHENQHLLWQVAEPAAGIWRYQIEAISTHRGKDTLFNKFCTDARGPNRMGWSHYRVTIEDAIGMGLVGRVNKQAAKRGLDPITPEEFRASCRRRCATDAQWLQEYMCTPQDDMGSLLTYEMLVACEEPWERLRARDSLARCPRYIGMDIGRKRDLSVIWQIEHIAPLKITRAVEVMHKAPFHIQLDRFIATFRESGARRACIDATGIGAMLAEEAARKLGSSRVEAVEFTPHVKEDMAMMMLRSFQDREIRIPEDHDIREDLHKVEKQVSAAGHIRYIAASDEDGHADRFWACGLAIMACGGGATLVDGMRVAPPEDLLARPYLGGKDRPDHSGDYSRSTNAMAGSAGLEGAY